MSGPKPSFSFDGIAYGGVYHADQWDEETWQEDIRLMHEAGVNMVSLAAFAWSQLELSDGEFNFAWLDRVLELLDHAEISVILATATATPPTWLVRAFPEMRPVTANGATLDIGARQTYCPSSPIWRSRVTRMAQTMVQRYGAHPAVKLWQISHEYSDHISRCYCDESGRHFRSWLQDRYGSIEQLNASWGTASWSQRFTRWEEVETPRTAVGPQIPAQVLDFERFSSDAFIDLFALEAGMIRAGAPATPITTNFISLRRDIDYWKFAEHVDVVSDNAYPDPSDPLTHQPAALNYDLMRSLGNGKPWLLLEHPTSAVAWRTVNPPKPAGQLRLTAMQAVAHGADSVLFNQWRQSKYGAEKFHSAILGARGEHSRSYRETRELFGELAKLPRIAGAETRTRIAMVVDWDSWWMTSAADSLPSTEKSWLETSRTWHAALSGLGHAVDIVQACDNLAAYDVVAIPNLAVLTSEQARELEGFVAQGGSVAVGAFSGVVDARDQWHTGGAPGPLRTLLGVDVDEFWPMPSGAELAVELHGMGQVRAHTWSEALVPAANTEVIGSYIEGELHGQAAITRNPGPANGAAWYVSFDSDVANIRQVLMQVLKEQGIRVRENTNPYFESITRSTEAFHFTFLLNHGTEQIRVTGPPAGALDALNREPVPAEIVLPRYGVVVIETPTTEEAPFLDLAPVRA